MFPRFPLARCLGLLLLCRSAFADGPADNLPDKVRPVPPPGIRLADVDRSELTEGAAALGREIESLRQALAAKPGLQARLPDVEIFHKAVDWALRYDEVFRTNEVGTARQLLQAGTTRVAALRSGEVPWNTATGLVVRGYRSRLDDSVQPYGLVIPAGYRPDSGRRWRLDFWFHGRGEQLSELSFLGDRMRNPGEFTPPDTFVLHLYGRYCNGSRFAGETDFWEALADVQSLYPIDEDRMVVRGFSLGGAACWHFATHHAGRWAAAAPGAGFSETAEFLNVFQKEKLTPSWWEQKLWRWYDSTEHALNVRMVPLVAYSGADDSQIQAARAMERALEREQLTLTHLIGPKTGHRYEPATKAELNRRIDTLARRGRTRTPAEVHFVTHTLKYPSMAWVTVDGLDAHWEPARVLARLPAGGAPLTVEITNVAAFSLRFEPGDAPFPATEPVAVRITDRTPGAEPATLTGPRPGSDASWAASFHRENGRWVGGPATAEGLRKRTGLQGPIDDAFMDSFLMVLPGGPPMNEKVGTWVEAESKRALREWRRHYRGDARQKTDEQVTDADLAAHHLVLWGDPQSNRLLARIADRLPVRWTASGVQVGQQTYAADRHVPVLVFPNPLNPARYVVLNSGFTFREYDYLNNARQTPKLPDWAVVNLETPPNSRYPGAIVNAGFFDEGWRLR